MKWGRGIAAAVVVAAVGSVSATSASAAVGDLSFGGCLSGETASAPACELLGSATADGEGSGLDSPSAVAASPDGGSVYALSGDADDAIMHFTRDPSTGALAFSTCVTGGSTPPCTPVPGAVSGGDGSGLDEPEAVVVSPDGASVYVAGEADDAVVHLRRDQATGALSFVSCMTVNTDAAGACQPAGATAADGADTGLDSPEGLVVSPDGRFLYALATGDAGIATFALGNGGGLSYAGCLSAETESDPACDLVPGAAPDSDSTGLDSLRGISITADGRSIYTADDSDDGLAHFTRNPDTGALAFAGCLTADSQVANCEKLAGAVPGGFNTGPESLVAVTTSPDNRSVYAAADGDDSVIHYRRDPGSGAIAFAGCFSDDPAATLCATHPTPGETGLDFTIGVAVAPDARSVYALGANDDALASFDRDPISGDLAPRGCETTRTETAGCTPLPSLASDGSGTGFDEPRALAATEDGNSLYVAANSDAAIARFAREADKAGPLLELSGKKRAKGKRVTVNATCVDEFCTRVEAAAKLTVKLRRPDGKRKRKRARLQPTTALDLQPGQPAALTMKLGPKAKKLIRKAGKGKVKVAATAADLLDNAATAKRGVKLKRKGKRR